MTKVLGLISSGIDSPVATYLMLKNGFDVSVLHFDVSGTYEKTKKLVKHLAEISKKKIKLIRIPHEKNLAMFKESCNDRYRCLLCKRLMYRLAETIAKKENCTYLVTGDNLGQVCSQTLANMTNASKSINMEILRPLLCYDKFDVIKLANSIGTFPISIEKAPCCPGVPLSPITKSKEQLILNEESKVDMDKMIKDSLANLESEVIS